MKAVSLQEFRGKKFETVVFAGGGNRCWWQAGLVEGLREMGLWSPRLLVGASAGAAIATASVTDRLKEALRCAVERFSATPKNIEWERLVKGQRPFVLPRIYPEWIKSFLGAPDFEALKRSTTEVRVAITRPIQVLPTAASTLVALGLYSTEKYWLRGLHGRLPHLFGLRSEQITLGACGSIDEASTLLLASGAAVPITPTYQVGGRDALDGGFYDNAPLPLEPAHGETLVLLTRHKAQRPQAFEHDGRVYLQPASPVAVVNMDCTDPLGVQAAFHQGYQESKSIGSVAK